jgi:hypothetical protein
METVNWFVRAQYWLTLSLIFSFQNSDHHKNRPTQRAATVLSVKAVAVFYSVGKEK